MDFKDTLQTAFRVLGGGGPCHYVEKIYFKDTSQAGFRVLGSGGPCHSGLCILLRSILALFLYRGLRVDGGVMLEERGEFR